MDLIRRHKALRHPHERNTLDNVLPHTLRDDDDDVDEDDDDDDNKR